MSVEALALPILGVVFAWWFSTGAILWLVRRPRRTHRALLIGFTLVALAAVGGTAASAGDDTAAGAWCAFACALLIWGWHEASFLMGFVTGPRPAACPAGARGFGRFKYATLAVLHHEVALALTLVALIALTWSAPNAIAAWTFGVLFVMRLSAKFNIFAGVPNLTDEFFPDHLAHLKSYLPKRAPGPLLPLSLAAGLVLAAHLMQRADAAPEGSAAATGFVLVFAITLLALIEHLFMIVPLPDAALWRWAAPARPDAAAPAQAARPPASEPVAPTSKLTPT